MFNSRTEFVSAQGSEKIVLAHLHATKRLITWTLDSGFIYTRTVDRFPVELKQNQTELTRVNSYGALVEGSFYYDPITSDLFVWNDGDTDPSTEEMIVTYRFFYSTAPVTTSWNLENDGEHVLYSARVISSPGFKHKVGIEQGLISLTGSGELVLENTDGGLDSLIDSVFFENQDAVIYSWNRDLSFEESQVIYRGVITNKKYDESRVSFTIRDQIFELKQQIPQSTFADETNVQDSVKTQLKRHVYGRVDGLRLQSIDQINEGYEITGTVSSDGLVTITGVGTLFLAELSPKDTLIVEGQEFDIESIESNTSLTLSDDSEVVFTGKTALVDPEIPTTEKNRVFFVTGHAGSKIIKTLVAIIQTNRVQVNNTTDLRVGDLIEFSTGERVSIRRIAPNNVLVLSQSLVTMPSISSNVIRQPVQDVFISGRDIEPSQYTITNQGAPNNKLTITLADDVEFNLATARRINFNLTFTNGLRTITTVDDVDFTTILNPRDWIKPVGTTYSTYYEILRVEPQTITIRTTFIEPTITSSARIKQPDYIGDDTVVSANVIGKTLNGEPTGTWIKTTSQAVQNIIESIGITNINQDSFDEVNENVRHLVSLALPLDVSGKLTAAKDAIDLLNQSTFTALTLDNDLNLQYRMMYNLVPSDVRPITDFDVINWDIQSTSGKLIRNTIVNYRHQDVDNLTLEETAEIEEFSSDFVRDYIGTDKTEEIDIYLYEERAAEILGHRYVYFNRLSRSDISIESDLRLEDIAIGDTIQLEFNRLYNRFGDVETRKKLVIVTGVSRDGARIKLECSDLGNTFNSSSIITPDDAPDYADATSDEKLIYGYITDSRGIVDDIEDTANIHLIS